VKLTDYLNSSNGPQLLLVYGGALTILNVNGIVLAMAIRSDWKDIPNGASLLLGAMLTALLGAKLIQEKVSPPVSS
jgi:uncharacterized membrane protein YfcA